VGASLRTRRRGPRRISGSYLSEINVTPFVDVMLVLLIVFMIAAPLLTVGVPLELPRGPSSPLPADINDPITVQVDADGGIYVQDSLIEQGTFETKVAAIASERPDARVYVRIDRSVPYGTAMRVLSTLNNFGFEDFGLVMDNAPLSEQSDG